MKRVAFVLLLAACSPGPRPTDPGSEVSPKFEGRSSGIQTYEDVDRYDGEIVTIEGRFDHVKGQHGVVILDSDLRIYLPNFDMFRRNDDWFKYVGRRVAATGRLHKYTKNIEGYHGPSLEVQNFSGPAE
jgi:hypothetical protein